MLPPEINAAWDANTPWARAMLIAYDQIRFHEETEAQLLLIRALSAPR